MPYESYSLSRPYPVGGAQYETAFYSHSWERSPRGPDGRLQLRANPWSLQKWSAKCKNYQNGMAPFLFVNFRATTGDPRIQRAIAIVRSDLRAKLVRKLRRDPASLGISLVQSAQAIEMFKGAGNRLVSLFSAVNRFYGTLKGRKRLKRFRRLVNRGAQPTAGAVLEGFFGWAPLLQDWKNALGVLADPWAPSWVAVSTKGDGQWVETGRPDDYTLFSSRVSYHVKCTFATKVSVTNPNLWIANRLGLINPLAVAWDAVPWSFLVSMVSNLSQIMNSATDFCGLTLTDSSETSLLRVIENYEINSAYPFWPGSSAGASGVRGQLIRDRTLGGVPPYSPYFRAPNWDLGGASIIGSLVVQQLGSVSGKLEGGSGRFR